MSDLPSGWVRTTIGSIADLVNGRAFKPSEWGREGLPIIRIQNLNNRNAPFNHFSGQVSKRHIVEAGDLLFAWSGTPGTSFGAHIWRGQTAVLNQHIFNIRVDLELVDRDFLRLAINETLDEQIARAHGGAGLRHLTRKTFEDTLITLPPFAEQRRIVERFQRLEERIAFVRSSLDEALRSVERAQTALLQGAYSLSLLPSERRTQYNSPFPTVTVGEVATDLTYGSSAKSDRSGTVPVLRMGNLKAGEIDWDDLAYSSDLNEIERYALRPGDVLFNRTNSPRQVGKTAVYRGDRPAIFAGYLIRVRCSSHMLPDFLTYCLNSPAGREYSWLVKSDGISQSNINGQKLAAFRLPCPSPGDQRAIVERVKGGATHLAAATRQICHAKEMVEGLGRRAVKQAMTGKLGTGDKRDEPAAAQLDRLKASKRESTPVRRTIQVGVTMTKRNVAEILSDANDWLPSQEAARLYGITFGASAEDIEPFYAELRSLDAAGQLELKAITDERGIKLGELLRLQVQV